MNKKLLLLKKEMFLSASPLSYYMIAFALMVFIPNYPILLGGFFVCFGLFQTFQTGREVGDIFYTTMLPVEKGDVVKSRYAFSVLIQMTSFVLMAVFTAVRMNFLADTPVYLQNKLLNPNPAYLGWILIIFTAFNVFFTGAFFKTGWKIGIPFLSFGIWTFIVIVAAETLHFVPGTESLGYGHLHSSQFIVLAAGALLYVTGTLLSMKVSVKRFERIDL